jgi:3-methyladenine DNA glycosylase/8-oxoguanine DNA glycosylase
MLTADRRPEAGPRSRAVRLEGPYDLGRSLGPLCHGRGDPTARIEGRTLWRATRTPAGPATQAVVVDAAHTTVTAWAGGPGADFLLDGLPRLIGADPTPFTAQAATVPPGRRPLGWDVVAGLARRWAGLRIPRTDAVVEACIPTVLEQKVTGLEARRSYRDMGLALGAVAPGPVARHGLRLPLDPTVLAATPSWALHRFGIERHRADTLRRVAVAARRLEEATAMDPPSARRRLTAIVGLGPWSAAEVGLVALGDADAVSVGDFHLPNQVAWALAGIPRGDDALMLELLEPWRGQRGRVLRLLALAGITAPKFGPRLPIRSFRGR